MHDFDIIDKEEIVQEVHPGIIALGVIAGALALFPLFKLIQKLFRSKNKRAGVSMMDQQIMTRKRTLVSSISKEDLVKRIKDIASNFGVPVLLGPHDGGKHALAYMKSMTGDELRKKRNGGYIYIGPDEIIDRDWRVIQIDPEHLLQYVPLVKLEDVRLFLGHEYGHVQTLHRFDDNDLVEYYFKTMFMERMVRSDEDRDIMIRCYYELPIEKAANDAWSIDPNQLMYIGKPDKSTPPSGWNTSKFYKFATTDIDKNILKILRKLSPTKEDKKALIEFEQKLFKEYLPWEYDAQVKKWEKGKKALKVDLHMESADVIQEVDTNAKRQQIEDIVFKTFNLLDPSGHNTAKYKDMFEKMSDNQFNKWIVDFLNDHKSGFRWDIEEFGDGSRSPKFENIEKAAKGLGINLFEYVYIPHVSSDPNRPVRTKLPVLVGKLNVKRTQQLVTKKTNLSLSDTNRDEMTGAMKGNAKSGTTTGIENELLAGVGGEIILSEIIGARGDNTEEYANMISAISETGSVQLADIKTSVYDKKTLLMTDLYLSAMGLKTDLISESYQGLDTVKALVSN